MHQLPDGSCDPGPIRPLPAGITNRAGRSRRTLGAADMYSTAAGLYTREVEVLRLLAEGLDTLEIDQRLSYSERTVRNIIHGLLTRMKLRSRAHAAAYALRNGAM